VAATEGFAQRAKTASEKREKERQARAAIVRDAANKDAIKSLDANIKTGGTHAPDDVDRVKNFSKRDLEALKGAEIESIAHLITESQLKTVTDSDKFTDEEKGKIKNIADPIVKGQKIVVDELRKLSGNLRLAATPLVSTSTRKGGMIDSASITNMLTEVHAQQATIRTIVRAAAPGADNTELQHDLNQLNNAARSLNELTTQVAKIPAIGARGAHELHLSS
jgi:hypothetical protein